MNRNLIAAAISGALVLPVAALAQDDDAKEMMEVPEHSHPSVLEHEHEMGEGEEMMMAPVHGHQFQLHPAAAHPHDELHGHPDVTVSGSLRYGVTMTDDGVRGSSTGWELGNGYGSRFRITGSVPAGAGLTAGFRIERNVNDTLSERFHDISLSGPFGKATIGRQGSPYYGASSWDGSAHLGGGTDVADKVNGVSFGSALGGPFDFSVFAGDGGGGEGADHVEVTGSFAAGPISFAAGYQEEPDGAERIGGTVSGGAANITLEVGYESATDVTCIAATAATMAGETHDSMGDHAVLTMSATAAEFCDEDRYGFQLSYLLAAGPGGGNAYVQYGERDSDEDTRDMDYWALGYQYYASEAVTINVVHRTRSMMTTGTEVTDNTSAVVVKVDF